MEKIFLWSLNNKNYKYEKGDCPNAEYLHFKSYIGLGLTHYDFSRKNVDYIIKSFFKVWKTLKIK